MDHGPTNTASSNLPTRTRPIPSRALQNAPRVAPAGNHNKPSHPVVLDTPAAERLAEQLKHLVHDHQGAIGRIDTAVASLDGTFRSQQEVLTKLTSIVDALRGAIERRAESAEEQRDALQVQLDKVMAENTELHARLEETQENHVALINASDAAAEALHSELRRVEEEHSIALMAKDSELEALRALCKEHANALESLKGTADCFKQQAEELDTMLRAAEQRTDELAHQRARRSEELRCVRVEQDALIAQLQHQIAVMESDVVNLAENLEHSARRCSGRREPRTNGGISPSTSAPRHTLRALTASDLVITKLDSLRAERDELREQLSRTMATETPHRGAAISHDGDETRAFRKHGSVNVPRPQQPKPAVLSLREARAQHKLLSTMLASGAGEDVGSFEALRTSTLLDVDALQRMLQRSSAEEDQVEYSPRPG